MQEWTIPLESGKKPLYEQIYEYLRSEIQTGRVKAADRLPSSRHLAENLQVSRSTVNMAYEQLQSEGYIESRQGSGFFAARLEGQLLMPEKKAETERERTEEAQKGMIDFSPRGIDVSTFPRKSWERLSREVLGNGERKLFGNGPAQGEWELRRAVCEYLHAARGVRCLAGQVVIGAGHEYLLMLLHLVLGSVPVAMETPTYRQAYRILSGMGNPMISIPMDRAGMRVDLLEASKAKVAYVMPSHQFPTGIVMPIGRRMELLSWASGDRERFVLEDDYDSEFRYKGKPVPSLQSVDGGDCVIYMGTFSRSIAPSIRVSYLVLPERLTGPYQEKCGFFANTVSRVDQAILARFLSEGYFERHLNKTRALYRGKHEAMLQALKPLESWFWLKGEHAGLHLMLEGKRGTEKVGEKELTAAAKKQGVLVYEALEGEKREGPPALLLGYANLSLEEIRAGAAALEKAWRPLFEKGGKNE